jgi:hypothetical protein
MAVRRALGLWQPSHVALERRHDTSVRLSLSARHSAALMLIDAEIAVALSADVPR